jgi:hypothetical protein
MLTDYTEDQDEKRSEHVLERAKSVDGKSERRKRRILISKHRGKAGGGEDNS